MEWTPWSRRRWLGRPWTHMAVEWSQAVSPSPCMMKQAAIRIWLSVPRCPSPISLRRHNRECVRRVRSKQLITEFYVCGVWCVWRRFVCMCLTGAVSERCSAQELFLLRRSEGQWGGRLLRIQISGLRRTRRDVWRCMCALETPWILSAASGRRLQNLSFGQYLCLAVCHTSTDAKSEKNILSTRF